MILGNLPADVQNALEQYRSCEFSTFAKDGTPLTWPLAAMYRPGRNDFLLTTSIGFPQKAYNIRRNPKVSMLFSDATGSQLDQPPAVLVQGEAVVSDHITTISGLEDYWHWLKQRQPAEAFPTDNALMRWLADWYYMRLMIRVEAKRVYVWEQGDFTQEPKYFSERQTRKQVVAYVE